jgi:predicted nucleic acid-binding Zn ribbon protein
MRCPHCNKIMYEKKVFEKRLCLICARFFMPIRKDQVTCSPRCQASHANMKSKEKYHKMKLEGKK